MNKQARNNKEEQVKMEAYLNKHYTFRFNAILGTIEFGVKYQNGNCSSPQTLYDFEINSIYRSLKLECIGVISKITISAIDQC